MGLTKYIKSYKESEVKELRRRKLKKKKIATYKELKKQGCKNNKKVIKPITKKQLATLRKKRAIRFTKAIGNPYKIKL